MVYYTVIKHKGNVLHLMFSTFLEWSQMSSNTRLRLLHLLYDIDRGNVPRSNKTCFFYHVLYSDNHKVWSLTNQSAHRVLSVF